MFFRKKRPPQQPSPGEAKKYTIGGIPATLSRKSHEAIIFFPHPQGEDAALVTKKYIEDNCDQRVEHTQTPDHFILTMPLNDAQVADFNKPRPTYTSIEEACENLSKLLIGKIVQEAVAIKKGAEEKALTANLVDTGKRIIEKGKDAAPIVNATLDALTKQGVDLSSVNRTELLQAVATALVEEGMKRRR